MMNWDHMGGWNVLGMWLFWFLLIVGIVVLVRYVLLQQSRGQPSPHDTALEILKIRYARGDISRDEYEKIKKDIAA